MPFFPLPLLVAGAAGLAVAATAFAQAPASPPELAPVVVESSVLPSERTRTEGQAREDIDRTPGGVELVPQKTIEDSRAANLKDVLDFVPGVLIRPRFGAADESQLSIRGSGLRNNFHLRGINVLIDGFPYGNADGFSDFESLELLNTRYIEVFKGANALRFGGNTMGGAINLVSKTGSTAGLIESRVEGGSYGFFKGYLATGQVYGPLDLYASFSDTELQGYRDHSEQTRYRAFGTAGYTLPGGTTVRFDLGFVHNEEQLPGALTASAVRRRTRSSRIRPRSSPRRRATTTTRAAPSRCARRSETTRSSSGRPSSTTRTSTTRCPSPSSTTPRTATAPSCAISAPPRSSAAAIASPRASSSSARGRTTPSSRTSTATGAA